jgi:hypothetical protein
MGAYQKIWIASHKNFSSVKKPKINHHTPNFSNSQSPQNLMIYCFHKKAENFGLSAKKFHFTKESKRTI